MLAHRSAIVEAQVNGFEHSSHAVVAIGDGNIGVVAANETSTAQKGVPSAGAAQVSAFAVAARNPPSLWMLQCIRDVTLCKSEP